MYYIFAILLLFLALPMEGITYLPSNQPVNTTITDTTVPSQLSFQGLNAAPQLAVSTNGQAVAIWLTGKLQNQIVGMFFNGVNWTFLLNTDEVTPFNVGAITPGATNSTSPAPFATGSAPRLAIDSMGNFIVIWVTPTNQIQAAYFNASGTPNASLKSITQLTTSGTSNIMPSIAINTQGFAMAVWTQNLSFQVLASTFRPDASLAAGGTWSTPFSFLPQPFGNQPNGVNPANFGIGNNDVNITHDVGTALWLDAPTGIIFSKSFEPFN
jgi:hypothetical protein